MIQLPDLNISTLPLALEAEIQHKIDQKAKPLGSLGQMERIAKQVAMIQGIV